MGEIKRGSWDNGSNRCYPSEGKPNGYGAVGKEKRNLRRTEADRGQGKNSKPGRELVCIRTQNIFNDVIP